MILRITENLAKKLTIALCRTEGEKVSAFEEWYANLFTFQRTQYILVTNAKSLFSFVMYGKGISNDNIFLQRTVSELGEILRDYELDLIWQRIIIPTTGKVAISKTSSKAVLGSMNDMIFQAKCILESDELSPYDLSFELNKIIFKYIAYKKPIEAFRDLSIND